MEDDRILELYFLRDEEAIVQTKKKYGMDVYRFAMNMLHERLDAEECQNDTFFKAWNTIPPCRPSSLLIYLLRLCRTTACNYLEKKNAAKRKASVVELTTELENTIPDPHSLTPMDDEEIGRLISEFLRTQPVRTRVIFVRRYWYSDPTSDISRHFGMSDGNVRMLLHRTREKLRAFLEQKGVII